MRFGHTKELEKEIVLPLTPALYPSLCHRNLKLQEANSSVFLERPCAAVHHKYVQLLESIFCTKLRSGDSGSKGKVSEEKKGRGKTIRE